MNAKSLGIFALGSLFGALVGVAAVKKYYQKRSDEEIEEIKRVYTWKKPENQIDESLNDHYRRTLDNSIKRNLGVLRPNSNKVESNGIEATPEEAKLYNEQSDMDATLYKTERKQGERTGKKIDYSIYARSYAQDDDPKDENDGPEVDPAELEHPIDEDSESDEPYEIKAEEAGYGTTCVSVTYFVNNNILVEANSLDEIDVDESIGKENLEKCLEKWEDYPDDPLYFRNEKIGLDYEVLRSEENYTELARAWNGIESN